MYKNKTIDGRNNISGRKIEALRLALKPTTSQRKLADLMQVSGLDIDKNVIQRIESGARFVTDIELRAFARFFNTTCDHLLE